MFSSNIHYLLCKIKYNMMVYKRYSVTGPRFRICQEYEKKKFKQDTLYVCIVKTVKSKYFTLNVNKQQTLFTSHLHFIFSHYYCYLYDLANTKFVLYYTNHDTIPKNIVIAVYRVSKSPPTKPDNILFTFTLLAN